MANSQQPRKIVGQISPAAKFRAMTKSASMEPIVTPSKPILTKSPSQKLSIPESLRQQSGTSAIDNIRRLQIPALESPRKAPAVVSKSTSFTEPPKKPRAQVEAPKVIEPVRLVPKISHKPSAASVTLASKPASKSSIEAKKQRQAERNTPEYRAEHLKNFIPVSSDNFENIMPGDYLRYEDLDGNFYKGGYVWSKCTAKTGKPYWLMGTTKSRPENISKRIKFSIYWEKVSHVWKKIELESAEMSVTINSNREQTAHLAQFLLMKFGKEFADFMKAAEGKGKRKSAQY